MAPKKLLMVCQQDYGPSGTIRASPIFATCLHAWLLPTGARPFTPSLKRAGSLLQLDSGAPSVNFREIHLEQAPHSLSFIDRAATSMMAPSPGIHVLHCAQTGVEPIHSGTCTRPHVSSYYRSLPSITPYLSGVSHEFSCTVARPIALAFVAHAGESCITAALEFVPVFPERHEPNCYTCISRARYRCGLP